MQWPVHPSSCTCMQPTQDVCVAQQEVMRVRCPRGSWSHLKLMVMVMVMVPRVLCPGAAYLQAARLQLGRMPCG